MNALISASATESTNASGERVYVFRLSRPLRVMGQLFALYLLFGALAVAAYLIQLALGWKEPPDDWSAWGTILLAAAVFVCFYFALVFSSRGAKAVVSQRALSCWPAQKLTDLKTPSPVEIPLSKIEKLDASSLRTVIYESDLMWTIPSATADPGELVWAIREMAGRDIPVGWTDEQPNSLKN
jgi:hypothetical protein